MTLPDFTYEFDRNCSFLFFSSFSFLLSLLDYVAERMDHSEIVDRRAIYLFFFFFLFFFFRLNERIFPFIFLFNEKTNFQ